jgi:hypothetical protein
VEQQEVVEISGGYCPPARVVAVEPRPVSAGPAHVVVLERVADLEAYRESWKTLGEQALEPNLFYGPDRLLPSLRAGDPAPDLALVLVVAAPPRSVTASATATARRTGPPEPPELLGLFPLERRPAGTRWPVSHLRFWTGESTSPPLPLLHPARAAEAVRAFFDWLEGQRRSSALLEIERLPLGGPVHGLLLAEIDRRGAHRLCLGSAISEQRTSESWLITPDSTLGLVLALVPLYRWVSQTFGSRRIKLRC